MFGGTVGPGPSPSLHSGHTRHVDDQSAALFLHLFESGPATEERAAQVDIHHFVKGRCRSFRHTSATENASVVHENIDPSILPHCVLHERVDLMLLRVIRLNGHGLPSRLTNPTHGLFA